VSAHVLLQGGADKLARANDPGAWKSVVAALTQGLRHLGFSQFAPKELIILENELEVRLHRESWAALMAGPCRTGRGGKGTGLLGAQSTKRPSSDGTICSW